MKLARTNAAAEFNTFVRGLFTEASPLTFPDNASISEVNFNLNRDGSRQRRLGMDFETDYSEITVSGVEITEDKINIYSTFKWDNAGGDADKSILAVQVQNRLDFFDLDSQPISDGLITTNTLPADSSSNVFSYTVVDGKLVVATGIKEIYIFTYDGTTVTSETDILRIRDLFGVEDIVGSDDLNQTSNIELRPTTLPDTHLYNLRNQTFAIPRYAGNAETFTDPIDYFYDESDQITPTPASKSYPSNADSVISTLYADPNDTGNRTIDRFFAEDLVANPLGSTRAPTGYFIIDALERGASRLSEENKLRNRYSELVENVSTLPTDKTPGGATVVAQFAGRVWYAGFSGEVENGDNRSPNMSSYVLFSRLVQDNTDITQCYQVGDPTSRDEPDLLDTDGGFLRIDGAYNIHSMYNLGRDLIITAENGVWRVTGGDRNSFTATNYAVDKISDQGSINQNSVVRVESDLAFWGVDGIYLLTTNEFGDRVVNNVSQNTIQTFYAAISDSNKRLVRGYYDSFERKIRWVYNTNPLETGETKELVYDVNLTAFYVNEIKGFGAALPRVTSVFETKPFIVGPSADNVILTDGDQVQVNGDDVTVTIETRTDIQRELNYLVVTSLVPFKFTFGLYKDTDFLDFKSHDGTGVDAPAELITGYLSGGDFQRKKGVTYLTTYMRRTETNFEADENGDIFPTPPSSCNLQVQWDWSDAITSGRWSTEREIYKLRRVRFPSNVDSDFDYGFNTVVSKNKLRGKGRVLSLRFTTNPGKDCHIYGWSMLLGVQRNV